MLTNNHFLMKKTLVFGASTNPERASFQAVQRLRHNGHFVVAVGAKEGKINEEKILTGTPVIKNIHTITLYMGAKNQKNYYDYLLNLKPQRIIFNPGAENPELSEIAAKQGIETIDACTLVMLSVGNY